MSGLMQRILGRRDTPPAPPETPADAAPVEPATPPPEGPAAIDGPGMQHPGAVAAAAGTADQPSDLAATPPPRADADTTVMAPAPSRGATTAAPAGTPAAGAMAPAGIDPAAEGSAPASPSFRERGRMRRRLRFLRRLRELGYRDLGGLVFEQHRFRRTDEGLVRGKVDALTAVDAELRALEAALGERRAVTELREPGLTACARCGAVIASDARFCSSCGAPVGGGHGVATVGGPAATAPDPAQETPPPTAPGEATERMAPVAPEPAPDDRPTLAGRPADPAP